jgi:hypothetical protein
MIFASKSTLSLKNLKILRPKVMKNLANLPKKFCEFPPSAVNLFEQKSVDRKMKLTLFDAAPCAPCPGLEVI